MKRWQKDLFIVALILSLVLHFGTGLYIYLVQKPSHTDDSVEIEIVDKSRKKQNPQQIVEQSEQRINDDIDDKAKYLSRHNQKVIEETRAANLGRFQNDARQGQAPKSARDERRMADKKNKAEKTDLKNKSKPYDGDLPTFADLKPKFQWEKITPGVQNPGPVSQSDDYLKDTKVGAQTLLSAREFVYYTYYSRIKDRLRLFWEPKIKEKVNKIFMSGRRIASDQDRITKLVITLDQSGKLVRVQVIGESGLKDLDDAAIEAFQLAAPFPNPPRGIVEHDGTIKIRWDFVLEA